MTLLIPKRIHQVWAGPDPFPYAFKPAVNSWRANHPQWDYKMWSESDLDSRNGMDMVNRDLYDRAREMAPADWLRWRADIARLEILFRHGGVYGDTDSESLKPLDELLDNVSCFFIQSPNDTRLATQAVMGCVQGHPFIKHLLEQMAANVGAFRKGSKLVETVGGKYITREMKRTRPDDVVVFNADLFSGQSIRERERGLKPKLSRAYVNHRYNNTDRLRGSGAQQASAWRAIADVLNRAEVRYWLTGQTMLGHVRDGRCIGQAIDLGVWDSDRDSITKLLGHNRMKIIRNRLHLIRTEVGGIRVNFWIHHANDEKVWFESDKDTFHYPRELFDRMHSSVFYHKDVWIPSPPEDWCVAHYGRNWVNV